MGIGSVGFFIATEYDLKILLYPYYQFKVYAYCLMDNHGHLMIDTSGADISKIRIKDFLLNRILKTLTVSFVPKGLCVTISKKLEVQNYFILSSLFLLIYIEKNNE
ncbi:transposase [Tepidibacter aestuarii]|nr:transposase [Tepidibacter aestuarii]